MTQDKSNKCSMVKGKHGCDRKQGEQKERRGKMEGRIEKHTLSCGQGIEREKHTQTSTRSLRECR